MHAVSVMGFQKLRTSMCVHRFPRNCSRPKTIYCPFLRTATPSPIYRLLPYFSWTNEIYFYSQAKYLWMYIVYSSECASRRMYGIYTICAWVSASAASQDLSIRGYRGRALVVIVVVELRRQRCGFFPQRHTVFCRYIYFSLTQNHLQRFHWRRWRYADLTHKCLVWVMVYVWVKGKVFATVVVDILWWSFVEVIYDADNVDNGAHFGYHCAQYTAECPLEECERFFGSFFTHTVNLSCIYSEYA